MNPDVIHRLNSLNQQFYRQIAPSFSVTRQQPWAGWQKVWDIIDEQLLTQTASTISICDIGCGNGRFANFCADQLKHQKHLDYLGIDQNDQLLEHARQNFAELSPSDNFQVQQLDLIENVLNSRSLAGSVPLSFSLVVGFGIIHHIPGNEMRKTFVQQLKPLVAPSGFLVLAFWQFQNNPSLMSRQLTPEQAGFAPLDMEPNDFFLTWERDEHAVRYCHLVTEIEQNDLIKASGLQLVERFSADGRTGEENSYVILQAKAE